MNNEEFYQKLVEPMFRETQVLIAEILEGLQIRGLLTEEQVEYIKGRGEPRLRRFYLLPKIHKDRASWPFPDMPPGRPIVSDCSSKSYGVADWLDFHLNPLAVKHPSYIKDTF